MVALMQKQEVEYKSAQDLRKNNAADGSWKGQFRDKFEERSEQIDAIQAGINAEAALGNIFATQTAQETQYIINPITGEVLETNGSFEDELSVASVIGLLERGASDDEIAAALDDALTSIAGKIASDKKNAKKYMAQLLEVLHVLELSMKQAGKNVELQNSLRQMQERMSKLMQTSDVKQMQEFLRSTQLREVLTKSVQQSRPSFDSLRAIQEITRNLAQQAKQANLPRELALQNLQQVSREILQTQLRDMVNNLREAYTKLSQELKNATDPLIKQTLTDALKVVTAQARELQELSKLTRNPELTTKQFEQAQRTLQQLLKQTQELAKSPQLNQAQQAILNRLATTQQSSLQTVNARLAAQRVSEGNLNIASQAGRQDTLANLRATENILARNGNRQMPELVRSNQQSSRDTLQVQLRDASAKLSQELKNTTDPAAKNALQNETKPEIAKLGSDTSPAKVAELGKSLQLSNQEQAVLRGQERGDIDSRKINEMLERGDLKGAKAELRNSVREQEAGRALAETSKADTRNSTKIETEQPRPKPEPEVKDCNKGCPCSGCAPEKGKDVVETYQSRRTEKQQEKSEQIGQEALKNAGLGNVRDATDRQVADALSRIRTGGQPPSSPLDQPKPAQTPEQIAQTQKANVQAMEAAATGIF